MSEFAIQLSVKLPDAVSGDASMVNLRADTEQDFEVLADWAAENPEVFTKVHNALRNRPAANTAEAVAMIQAGLPGSVVIGEFAGPPQGQVTYQAPAAAAYRPPATSGCDRCKTNPVCATCDRPCLPAKSIKDGKWYVHDCPSGDRAHKGVWCNEPKR